MNYTKEKNESKRLKEEIGTVLKAWFEGHDITPTEVARALNVKAPYVSALFAGKGIGKKMAAKLHNLYGLSESFLLTGRGLIDDPFPSSELSSEDKERMVFCQQAIQKANRIKKALGHLVDEGIIEDIPAIAPIIGVLPAVIHQTIRFDPEGRYDFVILRIVDNFPQFSLEWLLTGEGNMIAAPTSVTEEIMVIKNELAEVRTLRSELQQARDDFRDATYRMTQFMRNMSESHQIQSRIGIAAEDINEPKNP